MKTSFRTLLTVFLLINVAYAQVSWSVDPAHTNTLFSVNHLGISMVDGEFDKLEGTVETKTDDTFDGAKITFNIDVNSIDTRIDARDEHLKSDDFFNADKFPSITLKNAILKSTKNGKYTLTGDLTIRDVTKAITFDVVQNNGIITDPWGKTRAGFTAKATINRFDFNVKYNDKLPTGVPAVAAEVKITVNTELVKN